ncbi:hypothetical protein ACHQM5_004795 [Ranunculus cassubicifolius]
MVSSVASVGVENKKDLLRRKLQVLKAITRSKSEKKSGIIMDAVNYITLLKNKVEQLTQEYDDLKEQPLLPILDVKVVELESCCFAVRVTCEKVQDLLVSLVEAFEKMGIEVLQADINANEVFDMEAIIETEDESVDVDDVTETIYEVLEIKGVKKSGSSH